jgi:hypothetical protein
LESIPGPHKHLKVRAQATQSGGIGFLESVLGLLKSLKIRALDKTPIITVSRIVRVSSDGSWEREDIGVECNCVCVRAEIVFSVYTALQTVFHLCIPKNDFI